MFRKIYCTFLLHLAFYSLLWSQNIVYNGSFEQYSNCPYSSFQINFASHWFSANDGLGGSSEYFNACDNPGFCGVPQNGFTYQHARTGQAYAGTGCYENLSEYREYIEGELTESLISGNEYCVSFYVSLSDSSTFGIDALGLYFTPNSLIMNAWVVYNVIPQISNGVLNIITDKSEWMKISGSFTATGGERFFTVGNFSRNYQTNVIKLQPQTDGYSYYLVDDVAIWKCDAPIYSANAGADKTICHGQTVTLGTQQLDEYEYRWFNEDSIEIGSNGYLTVSPDTSTSYFLWMMDFKFDVTWDTVTVFIEEMCDTSNVVFIPNIFSPNNDGQNDVLFLRGERISSCSFRLFDRWGIEVFNSHDREQGWDGTFNGKVCPEGVYFYIAEVGFVGGNSVVRKGNVTLIR